MKLGIYKRVSTDRQTMASQEHSLSQWLESKPTPESVTVFEDHGRSGATSDRPAFQQLCEAVENGDIDAVLVYRLDRLSRRATDAIELLINWINKDVEFFASDQPVLNLGKEQPFRLTILSIFSELAQIERDTLISRVRAGMAAAKQRGAQIGRKRIISQDKIARALSLKSQGKSYRTIAAELSVSVSTAHRLINDNMFHNF